MTHIFSKLKLFCLSLFFVSMSLSATLQASCVDPDFCFFHRPLLEVKAGYFIFSDSTLRKIYDKGGLDVQLSASYPTWNLDQRWSLDIYGAVEYLERSGRSNNGHEKTSLWAIPVNVGLRPTYVIDSNMQYYCGIGPRYLYLHQHNNSSYVDKNKSKSTLGFFVNTGFFLRLCNCLVFDLFGEYSYAKIHFHAGKSETYTRDIQVGGFTFGGGLGYEF